VTPADAADAQKASKQTFSNKDFGMYTSPNVVIRFPTAELRVKLPARERTRSGSEEVACVALGTLADSRFFKPAYCWDHWALPLESISQTV